MDGFGIIDRQVSLVRLALQLRDGDLQAGLNSESEVTVEALIPMVRAVLKQESLTDAIESAMINAVTLDVSTGPERKHVVLIVMEEVLEVQKHTMLHGAGMVKEPEPELETQAPTPEEPEVKTPAKQPEVTVEPQPPVPPTDNSHKIFELNLTKKFLPQIIDWGRKLAKNKDVFQKVESCAKKLWGKCKPKCCTCC